ncbi:3-phosphoshikimate 1-carboxyvinyltransferase [Desulfoluna butyratoxydans]|uniref:3-phosphoshikimate 1-carboxyvinyltransferase n=1 Tax=Desulfoluna butyratoxydans TaxID=231438 RepID=A0A4U8YLV5_9BACT|nr:3-phosphoshikimate 1-carboxyvinyltransferase [Desulfoluna butyratoxydans]VFQ44956.1 3-phosphoshikimate 1-carboxyvinyltransferase [Desulfoluna butyratoxydans]
MREITPGMGRDKVEVTLPGSKSYSHRLLIAAALAEGESRITGLLRSEDTLLTRDALRAFGAVIEDDGEAMVVTGTGGRLKACAEPIYLANSGTSMRLLTGIAALGEGETVLTGTKRMGERPIEDLLVAMRQAGVPARCVNPTDCPPVKVTGGHFEGGKVTLDCRISSQFLSSLLLAGPYAPKGIEVTVAGELVSRPYVEITLDIMGRFGVEVTHDDFKVFKVAPNQSYRPGAYHCEPDGSNASYFWAAAAVTGKSVKVMNVTKKSRQGDVALVDVLEKMGCTVTHEEDGTTVTGGELSAVTVDMALMPDVVPTLAVVAAHAKGTTVIENVAHLREKECDRLGCVATELRKMGIDAVAKESSLEITGGTLTGSDVETYDDHRMAMSFSVAGLTTPGVRVLDPGCVKKSFPTYWDVFETLQ